MSKHALLVGMTRFGDPQLGGLEAPQSDVGALHQILADPERGGFDEVVTSLDEDLLTVRDKLAALLEDRRPRDVALLYYSGHGILDQANCLYLATGATNAERPRARSLSAVEIRDMMEQSRASQLVVVLDCCHSGAFAEGAKGTAAPVSEKTFDPGDGAEGLYVLTATNALQYAFDADGALKRATTAQAVLSRFTSWLIDGLGRGEAAPEKPQITLDDLHGYLCRRAREAGAAMTPQRLVKRNSGEMVIARNPFARPLAIPQELLAQLDDPNWQMRLNAVSELKALSAREAFSDLIRRALRDRVSAERDRDVSDAMLACLVSLGGERPMRDVPRDPPKVVPDPKPAPAPPAFQAIAPVPIPEPESPTPSAARIDLVAAGSWEENIFRYAKLTIDELAPSDLLLLPRLARAWRNATWSWRASIVFVLLMVFGAIGFHIHHGLINQYDSNDNDSYAIVGFLTLMIGGFAGGVIGLIGSARTRHLSNSPLGNRVAVVRFGWIDYERRRFRRACWLFLAGAPAAYIGFVIAAVSI